MSLLLFQLYLVCKPYIRSFPDPSIPFPPSHLSDTIGTLLIAVYFVYYIQLGYYFLFCRKMSNTYNHMPYMGLE